MKKMIALILVLLIAVPLALAEDHIIEAFRSAAIVGINEGEGERIDSVTLEDGRLTIIVYLPEENAAPLTPGMYAQGRVSTIGDALLEDESMDEYWDLLVIDIPSLGAQCYLGKKHIQSTEYGRFFDAMEIYDQIPD